MHKVLCALAMAGMTAIPLAAHAQYPVKPIRVIVPYAAGGSDLQVRTLAPSMINLLGQQLLIENREGGGGTVGATAVKNAAPDGYTLLYTGSGVFTSVIHLRKDPPYAIDDFVPIGNVIGTPFVMAARGAIHSRWQCRHYHRTRGPDSSASARRQAHYARHHWHLPNGIRARSSDVARGRL